MQNPYDSPTVFPVLLRYHKTAEKSQPGGSTEQRPGNIGKNPSFFEVLVSVVPSVEVDRHAGGSRRLSRYRFCDRMRIE
jgi:hypothetical protein